MAGRIEMRIDGEYRDIAFFARNEEGERAREVAKHVHVKDVPTELERMKAALEERIGPF